MSAEVHEQMSRSGGQSEVRPQCLSPQASLVLIYRPFSITFSFAFDEVLVSNEATYEFSFVFARRVSLLTCGAAPNESRTGDQWMSGGCQNLESCFCLTPSFYDNVIACQQIERLKL
ncbi:hypothetical protein TNCV_1141071 [Trichonephila clavipes]|nr:hypothetical protein TNCV_1141071 [Trichonephila clavipes]